MLNPLEELVQSLREGDAMPERASLCEFSCLEAGDAELVREAWPSVPVERRQMLMRSLVDMAEADFELDFGAVFRVGIEDQDCEVRVAAVEGLWEDEDIRLIPVLAERLLGDEVARVREAAAVSLGRFVLLGELEKIRPEPKARAYEALLASCVDGEESVEVRRRALESLSYVCEDAVVDLVLEASKAGDEKTRVSAVFSMGRSGDARWEREVRRELFSPNPEMRYEAARACGELELRDAVPELEELVEDADAEVHEAALWALGQIGGDRARAILERLCRSGDEATREAATAALEELDFLHGDLADLIVTLTGHAAL
jgi:HEAT repeat protein